MCAPKNQLSGKNGDGSSSVWLRSDDYEHNERNESLLQNMSAPSALVKSRSLVTSPRTTSVTTVIYRVIKFISLSLRETYKHSMYVCYMYLNTVHQCSLISCIDIFLMRHFQEHSVNTSRCFVRIRIYQYATASKNPNNLERRIRRNLWR